MYAKKRPRTPLLHTAPDYGTTQTFHHVTYLRITLSVGCWAMVQTGASSGYGDNSVDARRDEELEW